MDSNTIRVFEIPDDDTRKPTSRTSLDIQGHRGVFRDSFRISNMNNPFQSKVIPVCVIFSL